MTEFPETVLDNARISTGETVVDAGAGAGLITLGAIERVGADGDVVAIDSSVDRLEELRRVTTAPNVSFLIGSADVLPLPDESADAVLRCSVLVDIADKAEAAREFFRVLRSGGRVSLVAERELERFFADAGFRDVQLNLRSSVLHLVGVKP